VKHKVSHLEVGGGTRSVSVGRMSVRSSVLLATNRLVCSIALVAVDVAMILGSHGVSAETSLDRVSVIGSKTTSHLGVAVVALVLLCGAACSPACESTTRGVVVRRRWAVSLFLAVILHEDKLEEGRAKEEECNNDGNNESSLLESAGSLEATDVVILFVVRGPRANWSGNSPRGTASTRGRAFSILICYIGKGATESKIEDKADDSEKSNTAKETGQKGAEECPDNSSTGNTLNGLLPAGDCIASVVVGSEVP